MIYVGQTISQETYEEYLKEYKEMADKIRELEAKLAKIAEENPESHRQWGDGYFGV